VFNDVVLVGVHQRNAKLFLLQDAKIISSSSSSRAGFFEGGVTTASVLFAALGGSNSRIKF
jgi:hypothetical protein